MFIERSPLCFSASDVRLPISPMTSERMDRPCSRYHLAAVRHTTRNKVLVASFDRDAPSINQQRIATLHNQHVLIEFMDMLSGRCGLSASPKCHLTLIGTVKNIPFNTGGCLTRPGDPVRGIPHELRKCVHAGEFYSNGSRGRRMCLRRRDDSACQQSPQVANTLRRRSPRDATACGRRTAESSDSLCFPWKPSSFFHQQRPEIE